ncbi:MAG: hypothetical protein AAF502_12565 [Bacteroidota bacterium]
MKKSFPLVLFLFSLLNFQACKSGQLIGVPSEPNYDKSRITVLLKERVTPEMLVDAFEKYGLKKDSPESRTENRWIFTWLAKVGPEVVLKEIKASSMVEEAEFVRIVLQFN